MVLRLLTSSPNFIHILLSDRRSFCGLTGKLKQNKREVVLGLLNSCRPPGGDISSSPHLSLPRRKPLTVSSPWPSWRLMLFCTILRWPSTLQTNPFRRVGEAGKTPKGRNRHPHVTCSCSKPHRKSALFCSQQGRSWHCNTKHTQSPPVAPQTSPRPSLGQLLLVAEPPIKAHPLERSGWSSWQIPREGISILGTSHTSVRSCAAAALLRQQRGSSNKHLMASLQTRFCRVLYSEFHNVLRKSSRQHRGTSPPGHLF